MNGKSLIVVSALIVIGFLASGFFMFNKKAPMAYVDTAILLNQYQGMIDAKQEYQVNTEQWKANVDTLGMELERAIKKYEEDRATLSNKEKKLTEELLTKQQQEFIQYQKAIQGKMNEEDEKLTTGVLNQVNAYIKEFGKDHNYSMILGTTTGGNILYADDAYDVTQEVLDGLNKQYSGE